MDLPRIKKPEMGMLEGIKSKLGFAQPSAKGYDDEFYDDYNSEGNFDEFSEYGPDYEDAPASHYDSQTSTSKRPSGSRRSSGDAEFPQLVSIDDVRARTQVPESLRRDPLPARRVSSSPLSATTSGFRGGRTVIEGASPAPSSPAHTAAQRARSEGLNSLFEPSEAAASESSEALTSSFSASKTASATGGTAAGNAFDPYDAYAGSGVPAHSPSRALSVLKPASYGEVERIAKILKAGDAVILGLKNTPDALSKRILDFSFGVSSALDASVECISDKVFAITRVAPLSEAERSALRNQGVL